MRARPKTTDYKLHPILEPGTPIPGSKIGCTNCMLHYDTLRIISAFFTIVLNSVRSYVSSKVRTISRGFVAKLPRSTWQCLNFAVVGGCRACCRSVWYVGINIPGEHPTLPPFQFSPLPFPPPTTTIHPTTGRGVMSQQQ